MNLSRRRFTVATACSGLWLQPPVARAASSVIRMLAPTPPGAAADVMARILAEHMGLSLGQSIVVENKPGASGVIAVEAVLQSDPATVTLLVAGLDHIIYGPATLGRKPWNPLVDVTPVGLVNADRWVVVGNPATAGSWKAMVDTSRQRPLRCGNGGLGTTQHAVCAWVAKRAGLPAEHIPYSQSFMPDLVAGRIDIAAMPLPGAAAPLASDRLRGVALLSRARHPAFPAIPTAVELGQGELVFEAGLAMYTRAGTADGQLERLHAALQKAQADGKVNARFADLGIETAVVERARVRTVLQERIALNDAIRAEAFGPAR
jgi:tripartite-type tricarboxylate transporter receptor subunit TctC